jgi:hypothetical protein
MIKESILAKNLEQAKILLDHLGLDYSIVKYLPHKEKFDLDNVFRVIKVIEGKDKLELVVSKEQKSNV